MLDGTKIKLDIKNEGYITLILYTNNNEIVAKAVLNSFFQWSDYGAGMRKSNILCFNLSYITRFIIYTLTQDL